MPVTPQDVRNQRFTAGRLRRGYDMGEVDQFLDEVEAELTHLLAEKEERQATLEAGGQAATTADASRAATRLLETAGRNAEELVAGAQREADEIVHVARTEAERAQGEARRQLEALEAESTRRRHDLMGDLESQRAQLDAEVSRLQQLERSCREELRGYFRQQLACLDGEAQEQSAAAANGTGAGVRAEG